MRISRIGSCGVLLLTCGTAVSSTLSARAQVPVEHASTTYSEHIAPIVLQHCAPCHRPGQAAPFSLLTYSDVRSRAQLIGAVVSRRVMPPWKPEPNSVRFVGERGLSDGQIRLIQDWIEQGAVEGDPRTTPPTPSWPAGWQLGKPDLIVKLPQAYLLKAAGPDEFRNFVVPIPVSERRFVRGIEFRPSDPRVLHHATMRIDQTQASRRLDENDPQPGYHGILAPDARYPDGHFLAWTPGQLRPLEEDGSGWRLDPGSDLVLQLHMQPSGRPESVDASLGFYFTDVQPTRRPSIIRLSRQDLDIPANEASYVVEDRYVLPVEVEVRELQPHAHLLAKRFEGLVEFADGSTRPLVRIEDWDFRWQDVYRLKEPLRLPAGASLVMRVTYDNTSDNVRNPFNPPRRAQWGQETVDEMGDLWVQVVTRSREDHTTLERDFGRKLLVEDVIGHEGMLAREPANPDLHESLGAYYLQLGRGAKALNHLESSLRLNPDSAMTRYNLGTALLVLGRRAEAIVRFEEAIRLSPTLSYAHNSLGYAFRVEGRVEEAVVQYRQAIAIEPRYAHAHNNLGVALQVLGRLDEAAGSFERATRLKPEDPVPRRNLAKVLAVQHHGREAIAQFRLAVEAAPDWPELMSDLAWILAAHPDASLRAPQEALLLAQRAARLATANDPRILDVLSVAWAAVGRFDEAGNLARSARRAAQERQDQSLADAIDERLRLYETSRPYTHDFDKGFGR